MVRKKMFIAMFMAILLAFFSSPIFANPFEKTIRIGVNPWIGTALFYIAQDKGFFQQEKVKVEFVPYDDGSIAKQLITTQQIDILFTTSETVAVLNDAGLAVQVIAALDSSKGADGLIAKKEIKTVADLKNKTVALEQGSSSHLFLSYLLSKEKLSTQDIHIVNFTAADAGAAFVASKVDAAVTWEPWLSKAVRRSGGHLLADSSILPLFPDFVIVRKSVLMNHRPKIKKILSALFLAKDYLDTHPVEAQQLIARHFKISPDEVAYYFHKLAWLGYQDNLKIFQGQPSEATQILQQTVDFWYSLGLISQPLSAETMVDATFLQSLQTGRV